MPLDIYVVDKVWDESYDNFKITFHEDNPDLNVDWIMFDYFKEVWYHIDFYTTTYYGWIRSRRILPHLYMRLKELKKLKTAKYNWEDRLLFINRLERFVLIMEQIILDKKILMFVWD